MYANVYMAKFLSSALPSLKNVCLFPTLNSDPKYVGGKPIESLRNGANVFRLNYDQWRKNALYAVVRVQSFLGAKMGDAGLRELVVQSNVVAEGSVDKLLNGKQYDRAVRLHKCVYEDLMRLLLKDFESSIPSFPAVNLNQLKRDPNQEEFERVMNIREFREFGDQFYVYVQGMREKGSLLGRFWLSYLELCEPHLRVAYW